MDTTGNAANSGVDVLGGTVQDCNTVAVDGSLNIDIVVDEVDPADRLDSFQFQLLYDPSVVHVTAADLNQMLAVNAGSFVFPFIQIDNTNGVLGIGAAEFGADATGEAGNGVLARITLSGEASGTSALTLTNLAVIKPGSVGIPVATVLDGSIAVGQACASFLDTDGDGFTDGVEAFVGTDSNDACGVAAWPPDFNDSNSVDVFDVNILKSAFFSVAPGPPYGARFDLVPDGSIDIFDMNRWKPFFLVSCTP